jgi:hypothetical protein
MLARRAKRHRGQAAGRPQKFQEGDHNADFQTDRNIVIDERQHTAQARGIMSRISKNQVIPRLQQREKNKQTDGLEDQIHGSARPFRRESK